MGKGTERPRHPLLFYGCVTVPLPSADDAETSTNNGLMINDYACEA
jgi:hypothetical protein